MERSSNDGDGPDEYGFCDGHYFFGLCLRQNRFLNLRKAPELENYLKNTSKHIWRSAQNEIFQHQILKRLFLLTSVRNGSWLLG